MLIEELAMQLDSGQLTPYVGLFADDGVFLAKIKAFQANYHRRWFDFVCEYDGKTLTPQNDRERLDFAEWRMLCEKFEDKLEEETFKATL